MRVADYRVTLGVAVGTVLAWSLWAYQGRDGAGAVLVSSLLEHLGADSVAVAVAHPRDTLFFSAALRDARSRVPVRMVLLGTLDGLVVGELEAVLTFHPESVLTGDPEHRAATRMVQAGDPGCVAYLTLTRRWFAHFPFITPHGPEPATDVLLRRERGRNPWPHPVVPYHPRGAPVARFTRFARLLYRGDTEAYALTGCG